MLMSNVLPMFDVAVSPLAPPLVRKRAGYNEPVKSSAKPCRICEEAQRRVQPAAALSPRWEGEFNALRDFRHDAYVNIYEVCPDEPRIFGTESIYGSWDAEILLLAKDFAPWSKIKIRIDNKDRAFRASCRCKDGGKGAGVQTNENLVQKLIPELPKNHFHSLWFGLWRVDA